MLFTQLGVAAALVSVSSAFLLPPQITKVDKDVINTLPIEDMVATDGRIVAIKCPGCPIPDNLETTHYTSGHSMLMMNFTILHHDGGADKLLLNGLPIYPVDLRQFMNGDILTADQRFEGSENVWTVATLGYSMSAKHVEASSQDQVSLTALHISIIEVANQFISGIPSMEIKLLETPSRQLMIGDVEVMASPYTTGQECTTLLCKWKAIITAKVSELKKECGSSKAHPQAGTDPKPYHGHGRPRVGGKHRGHRHHKPSAFARFLRGIVFHVFIPIVIGIMVGIFASLIGMIVGHLAISVWRLVVRRGGNNKYTRLEQVEAVEAENEETKPFIDAHGSPPGYEEAVMDEKA